MILKILLLIAAYLYKSNHPEDTQEQVMSSVIADLKLIKAALRSTDMSDID